jgi:hypothetical protein
MKKILSLMALLLLTITTAWAEVKDVTYALQKDDVFASGTTVNVTKGDATVATITYGEEGGNDFGAAKANNSVDGYTAFTEGNGTNGNKAKGTWYTIVPSYDGTIDIAVVINKDKTLIVEENGESMGGFDEESEKFYGIKTFSVKAGKSYKCYVSGSKLGFYGFKYTWEEAPAPANKTVYFDNTNSGWEKVNIWAWDGEVNYTGGEWPGVEMEATDTPNLYKWSTTEGNPTKVIFSNNGANQTSQDGWDFVDGATYNEDGRVFTVTFKTNCDWSKAYAYTFTGGTEQLGAWPGKEMTPANEDGTWTITFGAVNAPETIIFNNNAGEQTPNLTFEDGKAYEYMMNVYSATFTTDANWETVKAYVWTPGDPDTNKYFGDWPGTALTANEGVYTVTIKTWGDAPEKIQFNNDNNGQQTRDMAFTNGRAYKWITKTPLYAISSNQAAIASGTTFEVKDAENDVVATLTYGVEGGAEFTKASEDPDYNEDYEGFQYVTMGNGVNGTATSGTVYYIEPKYDGTITVGVRLNGDKPFFILEDGVAMEGYNGIKVDVLAKTSFSFPVKGGSKYSIYCTGSKLGFYGFDYTGYTKPEPNFKVAGSMTGWNLIKVYDADSYTFENLAAGTYQFKVVDGDSWKGIADMTEVAGGLYWDKDGNVCFKLAEAGDVTVNYKSGELFTVEGNFVAPTVALAGSMNEWSASANVLVPAEDKKTASVTIALEAQDYALKMVVDGSWLAKDAEYELNRDNSSVEHVDQAINDGPNIVVKADVAGDYTFTWEYATNTLTVTYPVKLPTVALAGSMNSWSATANVLSPSEDKQTASVTVALDAQDYELKMVVDGHWLAKDGEYVLHRGWRSVPDVDQEISMGPNIKLQADVAGDYTFTWTYATNTLTVTFPTGDLTLYEDADNTAALTKWDGTSANVTLTRTLKTGMWNTFAAPFSIDIPTGWTVKELTATSYDANEDKVTMTFADAEGIVAGKPYLVKVNTNDDLQLDVFSAVTVNKTVNAVTSLDYIDFIPTLGKTTIDGVDAKNVLFLAAENKLKNPDEIPTDMKGFRAYFQLKGDAENARVFNLDLGEGETTSISEKLKVDSEQFAPAAIMYDLQGRRVQNAAQKGVYIMNGRKVVKK